MTTPNIHDRIENDFSFHPAAPGSSAAIDHDLIRTRFRDMAHALVDFIPAGREQSLMLTHLEEAMHWANAGVAKQGPIG